jgi:hypothetical protein
MPLFHPHMLRHATGYALARSRGDEVRALRKLKIEGSSGEFVFMSERKSPVAPAALRTLLTRVRVHALLEPFNRITFNDPDLKSMSDHVNVTSSLTRSACRQASRIMAASRIPLRVAREYERPRDRLLQERRSQLKGSDATRVGPFRGVGVHTQNAECMMYGTRMSPTSQRTSIRRCSSSTICTSGDYSLIRSLRRRRSDYCRNNRTAILAQPTNFISLRTRPI